MVAISLLYRKKAQIPEEDEYHAVARRHDKMFNDALLNITKGTGLL